MKKLLSLCLFVALSMGFVHAQTSAAQEQNQAPTDGPKIEFATLEHNYGQVQKGGNGDCEFTFTNNGNEPLILSTVKASCGCTTPHWTQAPIMPGQTGTIKVHYNTNNVGGINKTVTVTSNAVNSPRVTLRIKGNVVAQ